jgi:Family of unknown function (DUF6572)
MSESSPPAFQGIEHCGVIDLIAHDPASDEVMLVMIESRPWDGSQPRLFQLQEKINAYLSFALDGEMQEAYPELINKPLRLQLDCATTPDSASLQFLALVRDQIAFQGIKLGLRVGGVPCPLVATADALPPA